MDLDTFTLVLLSNAFTVVLVGIILYFDRKNTVIIKFVKTFRAWRLCRRLGAYTPCSTLSENDERPLSPPRRLIIGLFGNTGVGKSSLINSLKIMLSKGGKVKLLAPVASEDIMRGHTLHRNPFDITRHIRVVDNRGMDDIDAQETKQEVKGQLEGKRGYATPVDIAANETIDISGESVHLGVFVVRADVTPANYNTAMAFVQTIQEAVGRPPCAVITHKDQASSEQLNSAKGFLAAVGISDKDVYIVENTHNANIELDVDTKLMLLGFLEQCTVDGDYSIVNYERKVQEHSDTARVKTEIKAEREEFEIKEKLLGKEREEEEQRRMLFEETLAQPRREYNIEMKRVEVQLQELEMKSREAEREAHERQEYQRQQQILKHEQEMKELDMKNKIRLEQEKENQQRAEFERERIAQEQKLEQERISNREREIENDRKIKAEAIAAQERADKHKASKDNRGFLGRLFSWN